MIVSAAHHLEAYSITHYLLGVLVLAGTGAAQICSTGPSTTRVSVDSTGVEANDSSSVPSISDDGTVIAFTSYAANLVNMDNNGLQDVFIRYEATSNTTRASHDPAGADANGESSGPMVSGDGRFVVFHSDANNLVSGDTNGAPDVFVWNRAMDTILCASATASGTHGNGASVWGSISDDGNFVTFVTLATNFVSADTNNQADVLVRDMSTGAIELVSATPIGTPGDGASSLGPFSSRLISADGRFVAFASDATDLVSGDQNGTTDIFVRDRSLGSTRRVNVTSAGQEANGYSFIGAMSSDGKVVGFTSQATNLDPLDSSAGDSAYVHDLQSGVTRLVGVTLGGGAALDGILCSVDSTGAYVAFWSDDDTLVPGDSNGLDDIFVLCLDTGALERVSVGDGGQQSNGPCWFGASLASHGRAIAFAGDATNLVPGDLNGESDVFVRDRGDVAPTIYCAAKTNSLGCVPTIGWVGTPCASSSVSFLVNAQQVLSHRLGLLVYSTTGRNTQPFQGGVLCLGSPFRRTAVQDSGGGPPPIDCSGTYAFDFNGLVLSSADPALSPGVVVRAQYYSRDPGFPPGSRIGLTNAIEFAIGPY